ncbi:GNAT family N-acetyltransferase [Nocardia sp. NPDC052001]|uniref:GNAT family N-acetyltransferase n=1 Tax=Nocardia sp. NPDC052001 TaxID=3154853 RepID=UPI00341A490E
MAPTPVRHPEAAALLRDYYVEVADRYRLLHLGRRSTVAELDRELTADPADDLVPPHGLFILGRFNGDPVACVGLRALGHDVVELTRVFVRRRWRGIGGGRHLLTAAETAATALGATRVVLDTRLDLVEARALYRRNGYVEIPAYNTSDYAEVWYGKSLSCP